jgi:hypothetical protein
VASATAGSEAAEPSLDRFRAGFEPLITFPHLTGAALDRSARQ